MATALAGALISVANTPTDFRLIEGQQPLEHLTPGTWPDGADRPGRFSSMVLRGRWTAEDGVRRGGVALLGAPDDTGVGMNLGRMGARDGPAAFRSALGRYGADQPAWVSEARSGYPGVRDVGDLLVTADLGRTHALLTAVTTSIVSDGLIPVTIGGGHDLTYAAARGVAARHGPLHVVYLDAHLDVRSEAGSGMPMRALVDGGHAARLSVVGLDMLANSREHAEWFTSHWGSIIDTENGAARARLLPSVVDEQRPMPVYFSLDLDAIDAAYAPGVSAMNPCGISPAAAGAWAEAAGRSPLVKGFDIMELNPRHDEGGRTARLAAHLFLRFLHGLSERSDARPGEGP